MSIRRLLYQIDYAHILTFREHYKLAVAPYFAFENVEYAIDNENTTHEGIRLIFRSEHIAIFLRKEAIAILFEGNANDLKNQNGPFKFFWELFEKIKRIDTYTKTTRHFLIVHAVSLKKEEFVNEILEKNPYFNKNPFGKLDEFSCLYEFQKEEIIYKFQFGNYSRKDIKSHDLMPFGTTFNEDLKKSVGIMGRIEAVELISSPTFSKFKSLLSKTEGIFTSFNLLKDGE
jgi:hypothetical protein